MPAKIETQRIAIIPFVLDQQQILFWGRRVGYCGTGPNMPVTFLTDSKDQCGLQDDERRDVIRHVIATLGSIKPTPQTKQWIDEELRGGASDDRGNPESE
jgi:hypothetical protein